MGAGFGCGPEDEIRETEIAASRQDEQEAWDNFEDNRDRDYGDDPEPEESDAEYYARMDAEDAYWENYEERNNLPSSEAAQLDEEYFANYEEENGLKLSGEAPPYAPLNIVALPEGIDLNAPSTKTDEHVHGNLKVTTESFIGMKEGKEGKLRYEDSIETNLTITESMFDNVRRAFGDIKSFAIGLWNGAWNDQYPATLTTNAVNRSLYDDYGFPTSSGSPAETCGYEMTCSSGRFLYGKDQETCTQTGLLIFPKTRELAVELHKKAVQEMEQGKSPEDVIKSVREEAAKLGVEILTHGYYGDASHENASKEWKRL